MLEQPGVVVVAFGARNDLLRCLAAAEKLGPLVVVDNKGEPDLKAVVESYSGLLIDPGRNVGFAAAVNLAVSALGPARDVLLLNPDASLSLDDLEVLQRALQQDPTLAAVAPRLRSASGHRERTTWPMPRPSTPWYDLLAVTPRRQSFISGAILLIRADALIDVGPFDERFFLYAEEVDWQQRALNSGWRVLEVPEAVGQHEGAGTSTDPILRERLFHNSAELYVRKWFGRRGWAAFRLGSLVAACRRTVTGRSSGRRTQLHTCYLYLRGPARCARADLASLSRERQG